MYNVYQTISCGAQREHEIHKTHSEHACRKKVMAQADHLNVDMSTVLQMLVPLLPANDATKQWFSPFFQGPNQQKDGISPMFEGSGRKPDVKRNGGQFKKSLTQQIIKT